MRRRKGGRRKRPAHQKQQETITASANQDISELASDSDSDESTSVLVESTFARDTHTLAPSLPGRIIYCYRLLCTAFSGISVSLLLEWFGIMVLGLSNLWSPAANLPESIALVQRSDEGPSKKVKRRRRKDGPVGDLQYYPGMVNLSGVLCYMNSVLQSLASVTSLISHLERITTLAVEADLPTPVTDALTDVLTDLNTPHSSPPRALKPHNLIAALQPLPQIRRLLATREQQDAHELFVVLAEAISDESLKVAAEVLKLRGFADLLSLQAYCYNKGERMPISRPLSAQLEDGIKQKRKRARGLAQPWEGLIARRRVCRRCGWKGEVRMDTLGGMELPIPLQGHVTLDSCVAEYLAPELLSGVTCEFCSLQETLEFYRSEAARLALPPNKAHLNGHADTVHTASGSFSALEHMPDSEASADMSDRRKRKAKEAKKIGARLEQMVQTGSTAGFGEATLPSLPESLPTAPLPIKWKTVNADSVRQTVITRPPRSLRLHVARSGISPYGHMVKKAARVAIPLILDMTRFTARGVWEERSDIRSLLAAGLQPTETVPRVLYRLESVILHYGYTSSSGHFVCIRRKPVPVPGNEVDYGQPSKARKSCPDGCVCQDCIYLGQVREPAIPGKGWLNVSDDEVEEVGAEALEGAGAAVFMLFYERVAEYRDPASMVYPSQADSRSVSLSHGSSPVVR
ncbi:hypothetical protein BD324DRAFT_626637 [Kockovaella imperatae]|uniref:ubiquitinyl hydrolase 1 n=1 Tax=Kockovaella imperatae TaxID=4999 RepID=A0A1Y1UHS5_9TREE|nr:hypothetical protein BD324DRAFT_626637 [Kockovaella imperatae]ORX36635.1 hypothetical protein BD324DRAFT_626637 [Kockovaella imperatae]